MRTHQRVHGESEADFPYHCFSCSRRFKWRSSLAYHTTRRVCGEDSRDNVERNASPGQMGPQSTSLLDKQAEPKRECLSSNPIPAESEMRSEDAQVGLGFLVEAEEDCGNGNVGFQCEGVSHPRRFKSKSDLPHPASHGACRDASHNCRGTLTTSQTGTSSVRHEDPHQRLSPFEDSAYPGNTPNECPNAEAQQADIEEERGEPDLESFLGSGYQAKESDTFFMALTYLTDSRTPEVTGPEEMFGGSLESSLCDRFNVPPVFDCSLSFSSVSSPGNITQVESSLCLSAEPFA